MTGALLCACSVEWVKLLNRCTRCDRKVQRLGSHKSNFWVFPFDVGQMLSQHFHKEILLRLLCLVRENCGLYSRMLTSPWASDSSWPRTTWPWCSNLSHWVSERYCSSFPSSRESQRGPALKIWTTSRWPWQWSREGSWKNALRNVWRCGKEDWESAWGLGLFFFNLQRFFFKNRDRHST